MITQLFRKLFKSLFFLFTVSNGSFDVRSLSHAFAGRWKVSQLCKIFKYSFKILNSFSPVNLSSFHLKSPVEIVQLFNIYFYFRLRDQVATCPNCRVEISRSTALRNLAVEKAVSELPSECQVTILYLPFSIRF